MSRPDPPGDDIDPYEQGLLVWVMSAAGAADSVMPISMTVGGDIHTQGD